METVKKSIFKLQYENKDITADVSPMMTSVIYTDYEQGQSDEIEITMEDRNHRWKQGWYPVKGDSLSLDIGYEGEKLLPCGGFEIDDITFEGPPDTISIKALAVGVMDALKTDNSKAYEETTLKDIAKEIAKKYDYTLKGTIKNVKLKRVTQNKERDLEFLKRIAEEYGYIFKIVEKTGTQKKKYLVFTEIEELKNTSPVATIRREQLKSYSFRDKTSDIYKSVEVQYHDPKENKLITYTYTPEGETIASTPPASPSSASDNTQYDNLINSAAAKYNVDPNLVKAVMKQESTFNPNATSSAGAQGLMQLMPGTASDMGVTNAYDPAQNIDGGTKYLSQLSTQFNGDTSKTIAAYNAGPGAVEKYGGVPPYEETMNYVNIVTKNYQEYSASNPQSSSSSSGSSLGGNTLKLLERCENKEQAILKAKAALNNKNERMVEANLILEGHTKLVSGSNFKLTGFYTLDGIYHIKTSRHKKDKSSGYTTEIEATRNDLKSQEQSTSGAEGLSSINTDKSKLLDDYKNMALKSYSGAVVTSGFNDYRGVSVYRSTPGQHNGYDIGMPQGSSIYAGWDGTVTDVIPWGNGEYGVRVKHSDGSTMQYGHLANVQVSPGQQVSSGNSLGYVAVDHVDMKALDSSGNYYDFGGNSSWGH